MLRKALATYLNWDQIGISASVVDFENKSIGFIGQMTRMPSGKGLKLVIPIDQSSEDERRHAAMAIEGLIRYSENGNWSFPNGVLMLAAYAEAMHRWAAHLMAQIRGLPGGAGWDPVSAAVELLTIANAMVGLPTSKDATLLDWVDALFHAGRAPDESLVPEWRSVALELQSNRPFMQDIVRARASGTKGGVRGAFIDPTVVCETIRRVRRSWQASEKVPLIELEGRFGFKGLAPARKKVDKDLALVAEREAERRRDLVSNVSVALPEGYTWKALVTDLRNLIDQVETVGVNHSNAIQTQLQTVLTNAEKWAVSDALKEVAGLDEKERTNLAILGRTKTSQVLQQANAVVRAAAQYLDDLAAGIAKNEAMLGDEGDLLDRSKSSIVQSFDSLETGLKELGGEKDA
jgi:hypothetical protein